MNEKRREFDQRHRVVTSSRDHVTVLIASSNDVRRSTAASASDRVCDSAILQLSVDFKIQSQTQRVASLDNETETVAG